MRIYLTKLDSGFIERRIDPTRAHHVYTNQIRSEISWRALLNAIIAPFEAEYNRVPYEF